MVGSGFLDDPLTQWAVEKALDEVIRLGRKWIPKGIDEIRKHWPRRGSPSSSAPASRVRRSRVVNRQDELRAVREKVADAPHSHVICFVGEGGIGKTRLLEETSRCVRTISPGSLLRWGGIIDLYHAEYHSVPALQSAIVRALDPAERFFEKYRREWKEFEHHRSVGMTDEAGKDLERLTSAFRSDYEDFARRYRPVLAFDTFERINDEPDLVQKLMGEQASSLGRWLVDFLTSAPNSVFVLASRPPLYSLLREQGNRHHSSLVVDEIPLRGFTHEDSRRLLASFLQKQPKPVQNLLKGADSLWQASRGSPVWLALMVELLSRSRSVLVQLQDEASELSKSRLVTAYFDYEDPEDRLFFLLALARKGLTANLLHYFEPPWSLEECRRRLDSLRAMSLVKTRPGGDELFLHDALYDLFDEYIPQSRDLKLWYGIFVDYYREQQAAFRLDRAARGDVAVKLLYYLLQYDPCRAFYEHYIRWSETAIAGYEIDLDMQLRDELLLHLRSAAKRGGARTLALDAETVNLDSAVRWVKRYMFQAYHQKAAMLAESIFSSGPKPYCNWVKARPELKLKISAADREQIRTLLLGADDLFWGHLLTYYGDVLTYLVGTPEEQISFFLEQAKDRLQRSTPIPSLTWLRARLLGRVYDRFGYLARTYGHYGKAVEYYRQALPYLEETESLEELATTLNNLAFVLSFLGEAEQAEEYAGKAFGYRQQLGQRFPLALSHNTRGLIYASENYERAIRECQRAFGIFEEISAPRGIGLACNALGYILRKQGQEKVKQGNLPGGEECFQEAEKFLNRSIGIFSATVSEPIRLWEAHNEMGSLYYDWGCGFARQEDKEARLTKAVEQHHLSLDAFQEARPPFQEADTCEDLAKTYVALGKLDEATSWLEKGRSLVPDEYDFTKQAWKRNLPPAGEGYWLIMGKIWLQRGLWALGAENAAQTLKNCRAGVRCMMFSAVSFYQFWPSAQANNWRLEEIGRHVRSAGLNSQELQQLASDLEDKYGLQLTFLLKALAVPSS